MSQTDPLYLSTTLLILLSLLLWCYLNKAKHPNRKSYKADQSGLNANNILESFGMDHRPFEPENTLLHRNPWDDVDYIVPKFIV